MVRARSLYLRGSWFESKQADMESMENISIAKATADDTLEIQKVLYATWLATYPNAETGITREDIEYRFKDRFTAENITKRTQQFAHPPAGHTTLVAKDGGRIVGVARMICTPEKNEVAMLYVLPEYQGKKIGLALWEEAQKVMSPMKETFVNVVEYNTIAIRFYEKLGFKDTGERLEEERFRMKSGAQMKEIRMKLEK